MKFVEGHTVGIDLGTTFSCIAKLDDDGNPVPIANEDDEVETPSLVLLAEGGHVVVGPSRMRAAMEDPDRVIERIKREMGNNEYKRVFDGQELTPEFISALILKKLHQDAQKRIGKVGNAVITVPYYFNDARRKATQDAGRIAGLNVIDIINEPTAATLTYAWNQGELGTKTEGEVKPRMAMVYDLGGGTFDVTLVRYTPTHFEVLATDGDVHLGGVDWTDRLVDYVAETFKERHGSDPRDLATSLQLLRNDCDQSKIALSESNKVSITCRHGGKALAVPVTREKFEELTADLLQRTLDTTELVLDTANITASELDAIVLVGGSTLMPSVPKSLEQILGMKPYQGLSPHTAVAQGAAIHAAILEAKYRGESDLGQVIKKRLAGVQQDNVNSHGLGVVIRDPKSGQPRNVVMIRRNTKLPTEVKQTFATHEENQNRASVKVVEGEAPDPAACSFIGKCTIHGLPNPLPKGSPIEVCYKFNASGRVEILAKDKTGGKQAQIHLERGGGLNDTQIDGYAKLAAEYQVD